MKIFGVIVDIYSLVLNSCRLVSDWRTLRLCVFVAIAFIWFIRAG